MSQQPPEVQQFVDACVTEYFSGTYEDGAERYSSEAVAYVMLVLVSGGLHVMLPEIQEWLALGTTGIALIRQKIEKRLLQYAKENELDYEVAEKSAAIVAKRLDEDFLKNIVDALKKMTGMD